MSGSKRIAIFGMVVFQLAVLAGCALMLRESEKAGGWYIKLNIGVPPAKAIEVEEYDVTEVQVDLFVSGTTQPFYTVNWFVGGDPLSELIPVSGKGEYLISVTHISENGGEPVVASEYAAFTIVAMTITVINVTPGCVGTMSISDGGDQEEKQDGTLSVHLSGVFAPDGTTVPIGVYLAGLDPMLDPLGSMEAMGGGELFGGSMDSTMTEPQSEVIWIGTGGSSYDVYIWIDMNENLDINMYPEPGIDWQLTVFPRTVEMDGDMHLYFEGDDFAVVEDWR